MPDRPAPVQTLEAEPVEYFHAPHHVRPSVGPGTVLGVLGLALIFLGGCFMIGMLLMHQRENNAWSKGGVWFYYGALYTLAALCFGTAAYLLYRGTRSLLTAARPVAASHPAAHEAPSAAPGLMLGMLGVGLVFLGGCFMFGLLIMYQSTDTVWTRGGVWVYIGVLYTLAGLCFATAGLELVLAVKSLLRAARRR